MLYGQTVKANFPVGQRVNLNEQRKAVCGAEWSLDSIPSHHHIFAIWLALQAFDDVQLDLGLCLSIELHLVREQAHLSGHTLDGFGHTRARDDDVTVGRTNTTDTI